MPSQKEPVSVTHPELAEQAHEWDPTTVTGGSERVAAWRCSNGHIWESTVASRVNGSSCPYCSGRVVLAGFNDLLTEFPALAQEAFGWDPSVVNPRAKEKRDWQCQHGHLWNAEVRSRAIIGAGCPFCDGRRAVTGLNDLATLHPLVAAQAHGWNPSVVNPHSHKKMEFVCSEGHVVLQAVRRRVKATGCPVCQNDLLVVGINDLATTHPDIAAQADGWDPTTVTAGTGKKLKWKCALNHTWTTGITNRTKAGTGCPSCSGRIAIPGETDLATTHPDIAAEADGWDPTTVKAGTNRKLSWSCLRGHRWLAPPSSRTGLGTGCPYCSGRRVIVGETDLATTHPDIAAQADGWDPTTIGRGGGRKRWKCSLGHSFFATVHNRTYMNSGCSICANKQVLLGYNDLATTHPDLAAQADGWDPTTVTAGSNQKRKWRCSEGHSWGAVVASRTKGPKGGSGCPSCAKYGFNPSNPGWLYFLEHDGWGLYQIGITNDPNRRIAKHESGGWTSIEIRGPMEGSLARGLETSILKALKKRGAKMAHRADIQQFDGWTEAWTKDSVSVSGMKQLLDWMYEDDTLV